MVLMTASMVCTLFHIRFTLVLTKLYVLLFRTHTIEDSVLHKVVL